MLYHSWWQKQTKAKGTQQTEEPRLRLLLSLFASEKSKAQSVHRTGPRWTVHGITRSDPFKPS